jgi:hypothetical protein
MRDERLGVKSSTTLAPRLLLGTAALTGCLGERSSTSLDPGRLLVLGVGSGAGSAVVSIHGGVEGSV